MPGLATEYDTEKHTEMFRTMLQAVRKTQSREYGASSTLLAELKNKMKTPDSAYTGRIFG